MRSEMHSAVTSHLPWFITAPGETDVLYVITAITVIAGILGLGILFFTLHSLPERLGHKKLQFEIVAVLGLLSLFTHIHAFWVIGLLLALIDLPDFQTPAKRSAAALEKMAGIEPPSQETPRLLPHLRASARPDAETSGDPDVAEPTLKAPGATRTSAGDAADA